MRMYLGKDSHSATDDMTATHATVRHLTCRVEGLGHKIFMDNFFSPPRIFDDLEKRKINSCWTVWSDRKDMPPDFEPNKLKLQKGWRKGEDQGRVDSISLEGQTTSLHADWHEATTSRRKFVWRQQPPCETSHRGTVWPAHGLHRQFWSYGQQLIDEST